MSVIDEIVRLHDILQQYRPIVYWAESEYCPKVDEEGEAVFFTLAQEWATHSVVVFHPENRDGFFEMAAKSGYRVRPLLEQWLFSNMGYLEYFRREGVNDGMDFQVPLVPD